MIAAAIYQFKIVAEINGLGKFFKDKFRDPYKQRWTLNIRALMPWRNRKEARSTANELEKLTRLIEEQGAKFPRCINQDFKGELLALVWWLLARAYTSSRDEQGLKYFEKAHNQLKNQKRLNLDYAIAYDIFASKYSSEDRNEEAIELIDKAIKLMPDFTPAYVSKGFALGNLGKHEDAVAAFSELVEKEADAGSYSLRAIAYTRMKEFNKAMADHKKAVELEPNEGRIYVNRAHTFRSMSDFDAALEDYDKGECRIVCVNGKSGEKLKKKRRGY